MSLSVENFFVGHIRACGLIMSWPGEDFSYGVSLTQCEHHI